MKQISFFKESLVILILLFSFIELSSQNKTQNKTVIEIQKKNKIKTVKIGRKIRVWYEGEKYKGFLDSITPTSIFINQKEFEIAKIEKIGIKFKGTQITGAIIGTTGLLATSLGGIFIYNGYKSNDLGGIFLVVAGTIIDIIGIPILAIGSPMFFIGKKYKKKKGWKFKAVKVY